MKPTLYIVIPCYNEQEVLPISSGLILNKLQRMIAQDLVSQESRIMMVDDGSRDATWQIIDDLTKKDTHFAGVKLAHNRGHQNALFCGLMCAMGHCDMTISMDCDLQDDIEVLDQFVEKYNEGCEVVFGVRKDRSKDTFFKRGTAQAYYKFLAAMGANVVYNHADYRLLGSRALEALSEYREVNLFLRGMTADLGYKTDVVYYERGERYAGESKYPLSKMLELAFQGITSFSVKPLTMITTSSMIIIMLSLISLITSLILGILKVGIASVFGIGGAIFLSTGMILLALGIIGTYVGKIYQEVKGRPRFKVEKMILKTEETTKDQE